jgi:hypothetical protein
MTKLRFSIAIEDIIESELDGNLNQLIATQHNLDVGFIADIVGRLFSRKLSVNDLIQELRNSGKLDESRALEVAIDIVGLRLLPINSEFGGEPDNFLKDHQVDVKKYQAVVKQHQAVWKAAERQRQEEGGVEVERKVATVAYIESNLEQEKKTAPELFKNNLIPFLDNPSEELTEILFDYNHVLLNLLDTTPGFNKQLEDALYANEEQLTAKDITVGDKVVAPTIGNWLKDFVSSHGGGEFNTVVASQYVTNSPNARTLSAAERQLLVKLLTLYRTLHFFPASLNGVPPEQWQVIPVSLPQEQQKVAPKRRTRKAAKDLVEQQLMQLMAEYDLKNLTAIEQRALLDQYHITQEQFKNFIQNNG